MSSAISPWGKGFESRFLAKLEICGIFLMYSAKMVFFDLTNRNDSEKYFKPTLFYDILPYLNHNSHNSRIGVQCLCK
jgi:hypothetical protein